MIDVIIPSAKLIPEELQQLGKIPAVIYPVNQRMVFDYLYDQYSAEMTKFTVLAGENAHLIHSALSNYNDGDVVIKELDVVTDLGHTIYEGLDGHQESVIINFGDTIVLDENIDKGSDTAFCSEDLISPTWTFFEEEQGVITQIYDKQETDQILDCAIKRKLFVGVFLITHPADLKACLAVAFDHPHQNMSIFYQALQAYSCIHPLNFCMTDNWLDIGHADKYYNSLLEVNARQFNHITIDKDRGILRKTSDDVEKFIGEIKWYLKLPTDVEYVRPRVFEYSLDFGAPYVAMEYYAYHTIHEIYLYGELGRGQWADIFKRIRFVMRDFARYTVAGEGLSHALEDMYLTKTLDRLRKLREDEAFVRFFQMPVEVNGKRYKPLDEVMDSLHHMIPKMLFDVDQFCIIHGDLCFSNIMVDGNYSFVKFIDPRGKFGKFDIYGDQRYEFAKLFHSLQGKYDYIIKDCFEVKCSEEVNSIAFQIKEQERDFDLFELFLDVFKDEIGNNQGKIELIEALLFLSMIPLHNENRDHQLVMLATGLQLLDRNMDICCLTDEEKDNV